MARARKEHDDEKEDEDAEEREERSAAAPGGREEEEEDEEEYSSLMDETEKRGCGVGHGSVTISDFGDESTLHPRRHCVCCAMFLTSFGCPVSSLTQEEMTNLLCNVVFGNSDNTGSGGCVSDGCGVGGREQTRRTGRMKRRRRRAPPCGDASEEEE